MAPGVAMMPLQIARKKRPTEQTTAQNPRPTAQNPRQILRGIAAIQCHAAISHRNTIRSILRMDN